MTARSPRRWSLPLWAWLVATHLTVLTLPALALLGTGAVNRDLERQTRRAMQHQAELIARWSAAELVRARVDDPSQSLEVVADALEPALRDVARADAGARIVDTRGLVVATSGPRMGADLGGNLEVSEALQGRIGADVRVLHVAPGITRSRLFVAVPVTVGGDVVGAVVVTRNPRDAVQLARNVMTRLTGGALVAIVTTLTVVAFATTALTRSLSSLVRATRSLADGGPAAALPDLQGAPVREVRELAGAFEATSQRLRERLAYIGEFAAHVSHEFKTPLSTLRGTVELLSDDADMPADQRAAFLANAEGEIDRLDRLVSGLLALARAEQAPTDQRVDVAELAADVAAAYPGVTHEGPAKLEVRGNAAQIDAIVRNLVENALKHGKAQQVVVRTSARDDAVVIEVSDDGVGISPGNLSRVFDRFFTTDRSGGGTGLGLALVRTISRMHGGDTEVRSEPGRTVFTVTLRR